MHIVQHLKKKKKNIPSIINFKAAYFFFFLKNVHTIQDTSPVLHYFFKICSLKKKKNQYFSI